MTRWLTLAVVVVALSAGATLVAMLMQSRTLVGDPLAYPVVDGAADGPRPKVVVDGETLLHEFGKMVDGAKGHHEWTIRNVGDADLELTRGVIECRCTLPSLGDGETAVIKPGQSAPIALDWDTHNKPGPFRRNVEILTNDPARPRLLFTVDGLVEPALMTMPNPPVLAFGDIANDEPHEASLAIGTPVNPDLKVEAVRGYDEKRLEVTWEPLAEEDRQRFAFPEGGGYYRVRVKLRPTDQIGKFHQELIFVGDDPNAREVHFSAEGRLIGPISATPDLIRMLRIDSGRGASESTILSVRGQEQTHFSVVGAPEGLKVEVAPVDEKTGAADPDGTLRKYQLTVTVPPGTPPGVVVGDVVLATDHPGARQVKVPVSILIVDAS